MTVKDFRIDNLVTTVDAGFPLQLSKLETEINKLVKLNKPVSCRYDPDKCP